jgi:hypothetical protein
MPTTAEPMTLAPATSSSRRAVSVPSSGRLPPTASHSPSAAMPRMASQITAAQISPLVSRNGRRMMAAARARVSSSMITRNGQLRWGSGTSAGRIASAPNSAVSPTMPARAMIRPIPERSIISSRNPPMAYAATHLDARARPSSTPMMGTTSSIP